MKTLSNRLTIVLAITMLFIFTGCGKDLICIKGSGELVTREIPMDAFDGINLEIAADVEITQGETQHVEITAQEDILNNLKLDVKHGIWDIDNQKCMTTHKPITIRITVPTLTQVHICGSGDVWTNGAFTGLSDLDLEISGSGNMDMEVEASELKTGITGSGNITLYGVAESNDLTITGSGDIRAFEFPVNYADVKITGSGDIEVATDTDLSVKISGSGDVFYKGNPTVDVQVTGSGKLINAN